MRHRETHDRNIGLRTTGLGAEKLRGQKATIAALLFTCLPCWYPPQWASTPGSTSVRTPRVASLALPAQTSDENVPRFGEF